MKCFAIKMNRDCKDGPSVSGSSRFWRTPVWLWRGLFPCPIRSRPAPAGRADPDRKRSQPGQGRCPFPRDPLLCASGRSSLGPDMASGAEAADSSNPVGTSTKVAVAFSCISLALSTCLRRAEYSRPTARPILQIPNCMARVTAAFQISLGATVPLCRVQRQAAASRSRSLASGGRGPVPRFPMGASPRTHEANGDQQVQSRTPTGGTRMLCTARGPPEPCWGGQVSSNGSALPGHPSHPRRPTDGDFAIARLLRPPAASGLFKTVNRVARNRAHQPGRACSANPIY